ncbi:MAG TPA: alpha-amylase family glycosyl hydrolase [Bacteroidales bacterium]|nr:alpha-amylase family glycosyl hydrolase [Bacteroidales bacterium]
MNRIFLQALPVFWILLFFLPDYATAQVVTSVPAMPTANDRVVITFHADRGNQGLMGFTGDVYAHTGVITNLSPGPSGWRHVIATWNVNDPRALMTRTGPNTYTLTLEPSIRGFYNVPAEETIQQLAFVFRSADVTRTGRALGGGDIFHDVFQPVFQVSFTSPVGHQPLFERNTNVPISVSALLADSLALFINQDWIASTTQGTLNHTLHTTTTGRINLRAVAYSGQQTVADSTYIFVRPDVVVASLPLGVINGINYVNDSTVTLVLHDPPGAKQHTFVIGDFNNWQLYENYFMRRTPDGRHFWLTITGLEPRKEYAFQYLIDGTLRIADPYTEKILDPWHDQEIIDEGRYPGLIRYPHGKTTHAVAVLQTARPPFQWRNNNFVPPAQEDLIIYELHIRDFMEGNNNTFVGVRSRLQYLKDLGINAIKLMPIAEFEGNSSWGYNNAFFFAPDKYYGPRDELKRLIDEAHGMGIAVILDIVWNHSFGQSPLLRMYFDAANNRPADNNPWYMDQIFSNPAMQWGYKFDHGSQYFRDFMDRVHHHWLTEFRFSGFRFDVSKGFTTQFKGSDDPWGSRFDQERVDNLVRLFNNLRSVNPRTYVILEHLSDNSEETVLANAGMMLWGNLNFNYSEAAMGWHAEGRSNFSWASHRNRGWQHPHLIAYMESHDEERVMFRLINWGNRAGTYDTRDLTTALRRVELAATFLFTIPGPKMLWQFGELGYDFSINRCPDGTINNACRVDPKPVRWDYFNDWRRRRLHDVFSLLFHLRRNHEVFRTSDFNLDVAGEVKRIYLNHPSRNVLIIGNFGVSTHTAPGHFQHAGIWHEFFTGQTLNVTVNEMPITLQPGEYRMYSTVAFPSHGLPLNTPTETPFSSADIRVFPNPSAQGFWFEVPVNDPGKMTLEILSLTGQHVFRTSQQALPGINTIFWEGFAGQSDRRGIYLYRIITGSQSFTGRISVK